MSDLLDVHHSRPVGAGSSDPAWPGFAADALAHAEPDAPVPTAGSARRPSGEAGSGVFAPDAPDREAEALRAVMRALAPHLDPPGALRAALDTVLRATDAQVGALWLYQPDGSMARAFHRGLTPEYLEAFAQLRDWPAVQAGLAATADVTLTDRDGNVLLPAEYVATHPLIGAEAMAVVPLRARGARVGVAVIGHGSRGWFARFTPDYLRLLGDLLAMALDDARLIDEMRASGERQAQLLFAARAADERVRASHALLVQMLGRVDAGVALVAAREFRVIHHNPAFARLLMGPAQGEISGTLPAMLEEFEGSAFQRLLAAAGGASSPIASVEIEVPWPGPGSSTWSVAATPIEEPGDAQLVVTIHDLSVRRELEEQVRHAQKMDAVGTLAGGIAHEYNNLLTAILGNVALALSDLPAEHPLVPGMRDAETAALRAADLTRQLLGFSRRSTLRPQPTQLRDVVEEALAFVASSMDPRIVIERAFQPDPCMVYADPAQLGQMVVNLCVNARDAMPDGGRLGLELDLRAVPVGRGCGRGQFVRLSVSDTGTGIAPEALARIYEPFFTTKGPVGTGLGLSVVHGIVEQHGGWIECHSVPGQGTTFVVHLPHMEPGNAERDRRAPHSETVLVVDDEDALLDLARTVLERLGYRVLVAHDGAEGVEVFRREQGRIDVVVLDRTMPRLSGRDTLRELRLLRPDVAVVFSSGYEPGSGPRAGAELEADGFLPKPYPPDLLGSMVREVLDSRR